MDTATQWGLPEHFAPVRYTVSDTVKALLRDILNPNEPVIMTLANEGDTVTLVGTNLRLFAVKTGAMGAGASGASTKEFPWEAIFDLKMTQAGLNIKITVHFRSSDNGKTAATGRKAQLAKAVSENYMPFETAAGQEFFEAMNSVWQHRKALAQ